MFDIKELQRLTQDAIQRGKNEKKREDEENIRKKIALKEEQKVLAANILAQIPGRALIEAQAGRNFAIVMNLNYADYQIPTGQTNDTMSPKWIISETAKMVYTGCVDLGMNPTLEFWYNDTDSGYNIVVHW